MRGRSVIAMVATGLIAVVGMTAVGCGGSSSEEGGTTASEPVSFVFAAWGGTSQEASDKAWIQPWMQEHPNVKIVQDEPTDYAKIKAMVEAGNVTWDVVQVGNDFGIGPTEALCEKLDPAVIPFDQCLPEKFPTTGYRVPTQTYSIVLAYRPDMLNGNTPTSFADFFDLKKFPGKRGARNFAAGGLLEMALLADGVPRDELYPLDLERAFKKIDTIKDSLVWWETGAQSAQLLADGQVSFGMSWNGRITPIQADGSPTEIMWDQHFLCVDYLVIPKGSKNVEEATKFIAYTVSPENAGRVADYIDYGPTNEIAIQNLDPSVAEKLATAHMDGAETMDEEWWANNLDEVTKQWQTWITK